MSGRCDFFRGVRVRCGSCGTEQEFAKMSGGGGDTLARQAGWQIEHGPQPNVQCPSCVHHATLNPPAKDPTNV